MVDWQSTLNLTVKLGTTFFSGFKALFYLVCERYLLNWASHALIFVGHLVCAKPFLCEVFAQSLGPSSQLQGMAEASACSSAGDSTSSLKGSIQWKFLHPLHLPSPPPQPLKMSRTTLPLSAARFLKSAQKWMRRENIAGICISTEIKCVFMRLSKIKLWQGQRGTWVWKSNWPWLRTLDIQGDQWVVSSCTETWQSGKNNLLRVNMSRVNNPKCY